MISKKKSLIFFPNLIPSQGVKKLQKLFNENTFWAKNRSKSSLMTMLSNSDVITSAWIKDKLIGFGRATTDRTFRAVLWDIVVEREYQINGIGNKIIQSILTHKHIRNVERIYLMTTESKGFYESIGFTLCQNQSLMVYTNRKIFLA